MPLSGGHAIKLTTSRYHTPSGRSIQGSGIDPDHALEVVDGLPLDLDEVRVRETLVRDPGVHAALELLKAQAPRPLRKPHDSRMEIFPVCRSDPASRRPSWNTARLRHLGIRLLFLIVFSETVWCHALPAGDSLLFAAGALAAVDTTTRCHPGLVAALIIAASPHHANYHIGRWIGPPRSAAIKLLNGIPAANRGVLVKYAALAIVISRSRPPARPRAVRPAWHACPTPLPPTIFFARWPGFVLRVLGSSSQPADHQGPLRS